jgi:hypothetical protein
MRKISSFFLLLFIICLSGCFEITQEITVNKDGSGSFSATTDMSKVMEMFMQIGGDKANEAKMNVDTIVHLKDVLDSVKDISVEDKALLQNGKMHIVMHSGSGDSGKFLFNSVVPFKEIGDVEKINMAIQNRTSGKFMANAMHEFMKGAGDSTVKSSDENPKMSLPENYFVVTFEKGFISRKLDKDKIAKLGQDEELSKLKEMGRMGIPFKTNFVVNLPRPAKKVEGKNVVVSNDKKKITISNELEDLYEDPAKFEFTIEY